MFEFLPIVHTGFSNKTLKIIILFLFFSLICLIIGITFILYKDGYKQNNFSFRLLRKLGISKETKVDDLSLLSWGTSLEYLDYDADIAFIGDSITRWHNWQKDFTDKKVIELGISGDTLKGISERVYMLDYVKPEKVFIMGGGVNGLNNSNANEQLEIYSNIIDKIKSTIPYAEIYVQSTLPIGKIAEKERCSNLTIKKFNTELSNICKNKDVGFIDLYSLYIVDGYLPDSISKDGVHLHNSSDGYKIWIDEIKKYIY